jgi:hypothetical protein
VWCSLMGDLAVELLSSYLYQKRDLHRNFWSIHSHNIIDRLWTHIEAGWQDLSKLEDMRFKCMKPIKGKAKRVLKVSGKMIKKRNRIE